MCRRRPFRNPSEEMIAVSPRPGAFFRYRQYGQEALA